MIETLRKVRRGLGSYGDLDERQVESCAVEPVLAELGWEPYPWERRNQYRLGDGRKVDIALGEFDHEVATPLVFIECKRPGRLSPAGQAQLFEYAQSRGIPLLVLTDGRQWHLYLSMAAGAPEQRMFETLDLTDGDLEATAGKLLSYLEKDAVLGGTARLAAEQCLSASQVLRKYRERLARAWAELLAEGDETLRARLDERASRGLPAARLPDDGLRSEETVEFLRMRSRLVREDPEPRDNAAVPRKRWRMCVPGEGWRDLPSGRVAQTEATLVAWHHLGATPADFVARMHAVGGDSVQRLVALSDDVSEVDRAKGYRRPVGPHGELSVYVNLSNADQRAYLRHVVAACPGLRVQWAEPDPAGAVADADWRDA